MRRSQFVLAAVVLGLFSAYFSVSARVAPSPQEQLQRSPLAAYPGFGHDVQADEARFDRESLARERMIAKCMKQKGFPYTATSPAKIVEVITNEQAAAALENPNTRYTESLNPEQRKAYYLALYGVPNPNALSADDLYDSASPGGGGCQGEAFTKITGVFTAQSILNEQYLELRRVVRDDARTIAAEQRWAGCMQAQGYRYGTTRDLLAELDDAALQGRYSKELEQQHQQAVGAGRACDTKVGLENTIVQVRVEKETAFVAKHKATLDKHLKQLRNEAALIQQALSQ